MTAMAAEVLTPDEIVKLARKQIDAFNAGDWEQLRATLAPDARYDELGTQRKIEGRLDDRRTLEGLEDGVPRMRPAR